MTIPPVIPLRQQQTAPPPPPPRPTAQQHAEGMPSPQLIEMAKAIRNILATRVLLFVVIIVASVIWGLASWQPTDLRITAAAVYSVLVVWPLAWLYYLKG